MIDHTWEVEYVSDGRYKLTVICKPGTGTWTFQEDSAPACWRSDLNSTRQDGAELLLKAL